MKELSWKRISALGLTAILGVSLAGCGSSGSSSASAASSAASSAEAVTSASAGSGEEITAPDAVEDNADATVIQAALDANVSPYTYADNSGNPAGYDYEVLKLIDSMLPDYKFEYNVVDYDAAAIGLEQGQYDIEAGDKYSTEPRKEKFLISDPDYYSPEVLAVAKDSGIKSIEDMNGKTLVPVPEADGLRQVYLDYMEAHPDCGITQETGSSLISIADGLNYVASGRYDAMMDSPEQFEPVLEQDKNLAEKIVLTDTFSVVGGHFLLNKERQDLCDKINSSIATLIDNGTLGKLSTKWFEEDIFEKYKDMVEQ